MTTAQKLKSLQEESLEFFNRLSDNEVSKLISEELKCDQDLVDVFLAIIQEAVEKSADPTTGKLFPSAPRDDMYLNEHNEKSLRRHIRAADYNPGQNDIHMLIDGYPDGADLSERQRSIIIQFLINIHDAELDETWVTPPVQRPASDHLSRSFISGVDSFLVEMTASNSVDEANPEFISLWLKRLGGAIESGDMGSTPNEWLMTWQSDNKTLLQEEQALDRDKRFVGKWEKVPVDDDRTKLRSRVDEPASSSSMYSNNEELNHWWRTSHKGATTISKSQYERDIWEAMDHEARRPFMTLHDEDFARYLYQKFIVSQDYLFDNDASLEWQKRIRIKAKDIPRPRASIDAEKGERFEQFLIEQKRENEQIRKEIQREKDEEERLRALWSDP